MKGVFVGATACALACACVSLVTAQSLADVARQEEARRKAVGSTGKVYTNDDLRPDLSAPAAAVPARPDQAAGTAPAPAPTGDVAEGEAAAATAEAGTGTPRTEEDWRKRLETEREGVTRSTILADALQSQINALTTDFENRADPAQRSVVFTNRQKALAELERVKKEIDQHQAAIAAIQEEARRAGIPPGWVR